MDTKMHLLLVVLLCILQCQLFEFRALEGPATHAHQIPHHHHLRVARAVKPQAKPPVSTTHTDDPVQTKEPISKSTPVNAEKASANPTADKTTNAKQKPSPVEEPQSTATAIKTNDDIVATPAVKPTPVNEAADKGAKPETITTKTKDYNEEASKTQVEEIDEDTKPEVDSMPIAYANPVETKTLPKNDQDAAKEAKERPVTASNVWHKSSAESKNEDAAEEKAVACKECKALLESIESH